MIKTMHLSNNHEFTTADVYDHAAVIGKELEKIVANYGSEIIKDLTPEVIHILELLENITIQNEKEIDEITELRSKINRLENEKKIRIREKESFDKELEEIEDKWKQESFKLVDLVNHLKNENKKLQDAYKLNLITSNQSNQIVIGQEELDELEQIREENLKLKESLRTKDAEIQEHRQDLDLLRAQVNRISDNILNFRRKEILSQSQIQNLIQEKSDLECKIKEQEHKINELNLAKKRASSYEGDEWHIVQIDSKPIAQQESNIIQNDAIKNPNRPRYTLHELQEILNEKNNLTIKLNQVQEELEALKNKDELIPYVPGDVQGPINREPDEKLVDKPRHQSGIRRFFSSLFS